MNLFTPTHVTMHHSLTEDSGTVSWQAIRRYHVFDNGWNDIGYQYGIELVNDKYEILVGRYEGEQGAHCPEEGMNRKSLGIMVCGNFDEDYPDMALWNVAVEFVANIITRYNMPLANVKGHRDYNPHKSCPGKNFDLDRFRTEIEDLIVP
jgi:hypothetical protein